MISEFSRDDETSIQYLKRTGERIALLVGVSSRIRQRLIQREVLVDSGVHGLAIVNDILYRKLLGETSFN